MSMGDMFPINMPVPHHAPYHPLTVACTSPILFCPYSPHTVLHLHALTSQHCPGTAPGPFCPYRPDIVLPPCCPYTSLPPQYCFTPVLPLHILTNRYRTHYVLPMPLQYCFTPVLPLQVLTNRYCPSTVLHLCHPYKPLPTSTAPIPFRPCVTLTNWYCPSLTGC